MKQVLVLGASGMAGHVVATRLRENGYNVDTLSAANPLDEKTFIVDVTEIDILKRVLEKGRYDAVVNCIGLLVKKSDERKDLAAFLNAYFPHFLEYYYKDSSTKVIHLSTDCVFSGKNPPYKENSPYDGELYYDRSKALGEIVNDKDLTFRMSIVGPDMTKEGVGLFNWFYAQSGTIKGFRKVIWTGVTTIELARAIQSALEQNLTGLYNLVPDHGISKYDLLGLFKKSFKRDDITVEPEDSTVSNKILVSTRKDFNFTVSDYPQMVEEMAQWVDKHKNLYQHYAR